MPHALLWFRRDLRLADNPALESLLQEGYTPIPVFIQDEPDPDWPLGEASAWWLLHSLQALQSDLRKRGSDLILLQGNAADTLFALMKHLNIGRLAWNRVYEPAYRKRDADIEKQAKSLGITIHSDNAGLLREPWQALKKDETPYRVFTPFWKTLQSMGPAHHATPTINALPPLPRIDYPRATTLEKLTLLPGQDWDKAFYEHWSPGEAGAWEALQTFTDQGLLDYGDLRNLPAAHGSSRLAAHLHFGEISARQIWDQLSQHAAVADTPGTLAACETYLRQLGWREFSQHLLYHFPRTPLEPMDQRFQSYPWRKRYDKALRQWQQGLTGIPMVDAGMRELWETGSMHNRVRMIVASFLVKNLHIPWQEGARWFWNTLVDADLANNTMGWQWTAGCGIDAAPYFRVFNPVSQGERYDPHGQYVRRWIPEIAALPNQYLHQPWKAPQETLQEAGIALGQDYPQPMVDLQETRRSALAAWDSIKHLPR